MRRKLRHTRNRFLLFFGRLAKKIVLPGFDGLPLYDVSVFFIRGISKGSVPTRAASVAFNFFLALFPAIIFLFTLIPYVPIRGFQDQLLLLVQDLMPTSAYEVTRGTIEDIINHQRGGLLSVGFFSALYFSTNGINALINAFNATYHTIETRKPLKQRIAALMLTTLMSILVMLAIALIIFNEFILQSLVRRGVVEQGVILILIRAGKWLIMLALLFFGYSVLYYFGPAKRKAWRFISPGSTLGTLLTVVTSLGFSFFVNNFSQYNKLYGSIGTLIVVMLWIHFNSIALLLGFELNASIGNLKRRRIRN